ncbi:hypothetical protein [Actinomadura rubrisoli]|uniref:Uncharacterized protein n=1 Tax=Actinomadura rubrisoli TaxID=2530368 RepID=A0A4R5AU82_9ACTN|nr:hypothetical protein [Actinomadura rubrisoli]TDD76581.1 hypothetical protein E1298_30615 [Actinomadura rubrisoli]
MLKQLGKMGFSSNVMYAMGFGSIGLSVATWAISLRAEEAGMDRADRWGIFVGQWAPTFFALGAAMRLEEQWGGKGRHKEMENRMDEMREPMHVG